MNINEINKIEDSNIREIRLKYWDMRHKVFLDEHRISDKEFKNVWNELVAKEEKEISDYLKAQEDK